MAMKQNEVQEYLYKRIVTNENEYGESYSVCPFQHILDLITKSIFQIADELFGEDEPEESSDL